MSAMKKKPMISNPFIYILKIRLHIINMILNFVNNSKVFTSYLKIMLIHVRNVDIHGSIKRIYPIGEI